jgi:hypothetical protein
MPNAVLFTTDHGQRLQANTYYSDIDDASTIKYKLKKLGTSTTAELTAQVVSGSTTYAVYADITDGWLDDKAGSWIGQVEAQFANATLTGGVFTLRIKAPPTA